MTAHCNDKRNRCHAMALCCAIALLLLRLGGPADIVFGQATDFQFIDDPRLDGWNSEVLQDAISTQWKELAKVFMSNQLITTKHLQGFVHGRLSL